MKISWPKITIVLTTFNSSKGVETCLKSVKRQVYPTSKLEIVVIDNGSLDDSAKVARKFTRKVSVVENKDGYSIRADAMRQATGEFIYMILEQDMEFISKDFLKKLVLPLMEDDRLIASFTREYPRDDQPWITRFVSYDSCQRDPLIRHFTPSIEDTIVEKKQGHYICFFKEGKIPPTTHMLFRKKYLNKLGIWNQVQDFDHDTIVNMTRAGYNLFAYVPSAGTYHHHASSLKHLIQKRIRNLNNHFFPYHNQTGFKYIFSRADLIKMVLWVIYANLFFPATIVGIIRAIKHRDGVLLMEPIITICLTDVLIWTFLSSDKGRQTIMDLTTSAIIRL